MRFVSDEEKTKWSEIQDHDQIVLMTDKNYFEDKTNVNRNRQKNENRS